MDILEAAKAMKEYCKKQENCKNCIFAEKEFASVDCVLDGNMPRLWDIPHQKDTGLK